MLFSTAAVLLILSRTLTKAHPPDGRDKELTTSGLACLYMTTEPNWQGEGQNICDVPGVCSVSLPTGLNQNVSSAGPTEGSTCYLYDGESCTGTRSAPIVYPGYAQLGDISFAKQAQSWICWSSSGTTTLAANPSTTILTTSVDTVVQSTISSILTATASQAPTTSIIQAASAVESTATLTHTYADGTTTLTTIVV